MSLVSQYYPNGTQHEYETATEAGGGWHTSFFRNELARNGSWLAMLTIPGPGLSCPRFPEILPPSPIWVYEGHRRCTWEILDRPLLLTRWGVRGCSGIFCRSHCAGSNAVGAAKTGQPLEEIEELLGKCLAGPGDAAPILVTKHPSGPSRSPLLDERRRMTGAPLAPALAFKTRLSAASRALMPMYGVCAVVFPETRGRLERSRDGVWRFGREPRSSRFYMSILWNEQADTYDVAVPLWRQISSTGRQYHKSVPLPFVVKCIPFCLRLAAPSLP